MPTNHAAVAALPIASDANKTLLRNAITARMPYVLADADDVTDLVAVDPDTSSAIIDILFLGRLFHYDSTDTTTANDGITCLVTSDGRRYKLSDGSDVFAYSVLDNAIATPPGSPTIGDAYLIASGATGAWAGKANYIGTYTRRGWEFIDFGIGRFVYVEDTDTYYHKDSGGAWVAGFGNGTFNANSIPLSAAINFGKRLIVEDQTTTAPPGTPTLGDAYIIGSSPTGAWAGHATEIAICEDGSTFTLYTPTNGWAAYDKATNKEYVHNGTIWVPSLGAWIDEDSIFTANLTNNPTGSGTYTYSHTTAPTTSVSLNKDAVTLTWTARETGAKLRFRYEASFSAGGNGLYTLGLFRDAVAAALDWRPIGLLTADMSASAEFEISAPDALSHTYYVAFISGSAGVANGMARRRFSVMEASQ